MPVRTQYWVHIPVANLRLPSSLSPTGSPRSRRSSTPGRLARPPSRATVTPFPQTQHRTAVQLPYPANVPSIARPRCTDRVKKLHASSVRLYRPTALGTYPVRLTDNRECNMYPDSVVEWVSRWTRAASSLRFGVPAVWRSYRTASRAPVHAKQRTHVATHGCTYGIRWEYGAREALGNTTACGSLGAAY
ncbi:hypothetical protein BDW22DRAFT_667687 [Trametopsis cervina]|nr:hypothetical protein BDW22DRAFT_667687 [Trametopsis cervina]